MRNISPFVVDGYCCLREPQATDAKGYGYEKHWIRENTDIRSNGYDGNGYERVRIIYRQGTGLIFHVKNILRLRFLGFLGERIAFFFEKQHLNLKSIPHTLHNL